MMFKKLLAVVFVATACMTFAFAQAAKTDKGQAKAPHASAKMSGKTVKVYACEKCEMASKKPGNCPMCKEPMKAITGKVVYMCDHCHTTASKAGKCPKCGMAMVKGVETYVCEMDGTSSSKPGKCEKCGMDLKKVDMKMSAKK